MLTVGVLLAFEAVLRGGDDGGHCSGRGCFFFELRAGGLEFTGRVCAFFDKDDGTVRKFSVRSGAGFLSRPRHNFSNSIHGLSPKFFLTGASASAADGEAVVLALVSKDLVPARIFLSVAEAAAFEAAVPSPAALS